MLTKSDLSSIGQLLDQKLTEQDKRFGKKLKPIRRELKIIRGALNGTIRVQEREQGHLKKRVDRLDDHFHLEHLPEPTTHIPTQVFA